MVVWFQLRQVGQTQNFGADNDTGREVDLTATATLSRRHMDGRINDLRQSPTATAWALCKMPFGDVYRILQG